MDVERDTTALVEQLFESVAIDGGRSYARQLGSLLRDSGLALPSITVRYSGLTVDAMAAPPDRANPSVWNAFMSTLALLRCGGGADGTEVRLLHGVSGVLRPGALTLLLAPPGGGKSLLMGALAGRVRSTKNTKVWCCNPVRCLK
jgi:hypothetical protein